ncbi:MAG: ABC-2 transporter permease [Oscillospiraceae bacterium]|nr:ABC-2 transporter permease [Oscillospiraceae bacterium]
MLGLIYKDFTVQKYLIVVSVLFIVFFSFFTFSANSVVTYEGESEIMVSSMVLAGVAFMVFIGGSIIPETAFYSDEKSRFNVYAKCLPTTASKTVLARYLLMLMMYGGCFVVLVIFLIFNPGVNNVTLNLLMPLTAFAIFVAFDSFSYAFYYRFGVKRGGTFKLIFLITLPLMLCMYLLFGDLSVFGERGMEDLFTWIMTLSVEKFFEDVCLPVCVFALVVFIGCYFISARVYRKGLETGEN